MLSYSPALEKQTTLKGIVYTIFRSLPLKGNCLFISFCKQEAHFLSHPMPKVAISKQREVNGREQFRCNLLPGSACVSVSTSRKATIKQIYKHTFTCINKDMHIYFLIPLSPLTLQSLSEEMSLNTRMCLTEMKVFAMFGKQMRQGSGVIGLLWDPSLLSQ